MIAVSALCCLFKNVLKFHRIFSNFSLSMGSSFKNLDGGNFSWIVNQTTAKGRKGSFFQPFAQTLHSKYSTHIYIYDVGNSSLAVCVHERNQYCNSQCLLFDDPTSAKLMSRSGFEFTSTFVPSKIQRSAHTLLTENFVNIRFLSCCHVARKSFFSVCR